ncbi:uncharacterized protein MYCFIDRAFT_130685 [Pseudocercospora fijiensis CIRAD86]|uniref:Metallo-beta-lactamase domain-containing protein n=1 Tax=Pseudocercospora fijiensis (strain CIRAD86) TaxID=383855 RepID=M3A7E3_PSEFD|nr:uncharacterized protein MYCFIDRAFT_130685 [Pseudocercospora fijiensis CIRAD86]EME87009.1 hypothetical protein MYCFIDRAFT_130685 [Pseudocercospora fijiensis CIRAD86]
MPSPLPPPRPDQAYVTVSPIPGGFITLSDTFFVKPADPTAKRTVPSLTFLIQHPNPPPSSGYTSHPNKPFRLMFDLGLRKSQSRYPLPLQKHIDSRAPFLLEPGVAQQLQDAGLSPSAINLVILSHVHYDHHGDPEDFPQAHFLLGHGALHVLKYGLGGTASHQHFDPNTFPPDRTSELPDPKTWHESLGPFPHVYDLFHDSSVYVIDTPGHLPGHLNLLCRTQERWVLLCGDAFHDRRLLTGEREIGTWVVEVEGRRTVCCIHVDEEEARESIRRLRELESGTGGECELIAAHEEDWWERHKDQVFPGTI